MSPIERKAAFQYAATVKGMTLDAAANLVCGVTWFHLSEGIKDLPHRPLSEAVKGKFAGFIGMPVGRVFGPAAASRRRKRSAA